MENTPIIYTYGNNNIDAKDLIYILHPYHIDCVVDCRPPAYTKGMTNTPSNELKEILSKNNIIYLPFAQYFGVFPNEARNKKGNVLYSKIIKTKDFLEGINRIENGVQKGYTICIIDHQREIAKSKRYTFIGKFLHERYTICHILPSGSYYTQEQVVQKQAEYTNLYKQQNSKIQTVGKTGEELAALYLCKNGYQILDHNRNLHRGCELDIVGLKDNKIHFIEVKTRASDKYTEPQIAINRVKMKNISKAIQQYRYRHRLFNCAFQIDSIAIIYRTEHDYDLRHYLDIRPDGSACADIIVFQQRPQQT